jgi:hypothetical protein
MTAHYIAQHVEAKLNQINLNVIPYHNAGDRSLERFNKACSLLEDYIATNFLSFVETELVYKWAKGSCEARNSFDNWYRAYGYHYPIEQALEKWKGPHWTLAYRQKDRKWWKQKDTWK